MSGRGAERILDLIEWMAERPAAVSLVELATALAIPKSSALLLVRTLVGRGYVARDEAGRYRLMRLPGEGGAGRAAHDTLCRLAAPFVKEGVDAIGETGCVAVFLPSGHIQYVLKTLPQREIVYDRDITVGRTAHHVASGLMLLSGLPAEALAHYLAHNLERGETTAAVAAAIETARQDGYAVNLHGKIEGAAGVAAPIFDRSGTMVGAINYCGPKDRFTAHLDRAIGEVVATATRVSEEFARRFNPTKPKREDLPHVA